MAHARPTIAPAEVRKVQEQFARWRASKQGRERIPQRLWRAAARLCEAHSVNRVARWLRMNHTALQDRTGGRSSPPRSHPAPTFVEWRAPAAMFPGASSTEYVLEVEGAGERTVRIRVRGATVSEVVALARALRRNENERWTP